MIWIFAIFYFICLLIIFGYAVLQFNLSRAYRSAKLKEIEEIVPLKEFPFVTIQLPLYNEQYVAERIIDAVTKINYPADKLQIQVLDDSSDITTQILRNSIKKYKNQGVNIVLVLRDDRKGYKAGALQHGLKSATGEFIAIFDADFIPDPDFLYKTLPYFKDKGIGMVQTRWEHLNRDSSLLTKLQAFGLDAHFSVEQVGRSSQNHFINFNGTGGVWRLKTIEDAGGWQNDTLTEDLDLSYRSQLKGWRFKYLENVFSPAELPVAISALKNQQYRWTKGGAENFKKMSLRLLFQSNLRFSDRLHGLAHLFNSTVYIFVFLAAILSVPVIYAAAGNDNIDVFLSWMAVFFISTILLMRFYWVSYREPHRKKWARGVIFVWRFFQYLTISLGLSFYNTQGILLAYIGKKTAFVRTPKFNVSGSQKKWQKNVYIYQKLKFSTVMEFLLAIYFIYGIYTSFKFEYYGMIPFQFMLFIGFFTVAIYTLKEQFQE